MKKIIILLASTLTLNSVTAQEKNTVSTKTLTTTVVKKKKKTATSKTPVAKKTVTAAANETKAVTSLETETVIPKQHPNPLPIAPMYPQGQQAMLDFIKSNIKVPFDVSKNNIILIVTVSFKVATDGSLKEIKAVKTDPYGCDGEAERIVKAMPKWTPGRVGRQFVEMPMAIDIEFK